MKVINYKDVPVETITEDACGVSIRRVITEGMGANNFVMRHFEVLSDGYTPLHTHEREHEVFILDGNGIFVGDAAEKPFGQGDKTLSLLCLIPSKGKCNL